MPEQLLQTLEAAAAKHSPSMLLNSQVKDIRGAHAVEKFGSYVERGGSGAIFTRKIDAKYAEFFIEIDDVGM